MNQITTNPLNPIDAKHLKQHGFMRVTCDCGHELFVWPRNVNARTRATCLRCKNGKAYVIDGKRKSVTVTDLT